MIKTKQRLIIFGSSWLVGVWHCTGPGQVSIQYPGVAKILKSTFHTVNNSVAGSGPFQVLYGIRHYLGTFLNKDDDIILVGMPDIESSEQADKFDVDYKQILDKSETYKEFHQRIREIFFIKAQMLAERYNRTFYFIGTSSDIVDTLDEYPNIKILVPSWIQLCNPDYIPRYAPLIINPVIAEFAKTNNRLEIIDEIFDLSDKNFTDFQKLMESQCFQNPGAEADFHPNLQGHELLAEEILRKL